MRWSSSSRFGDRGLASSRFASSRRAIRRSSSRRAKARSLYPKRHPALNFGQDRHQDEGTSRSEPRGSWCVSASAAAHRLERGGRVSEGRRVGELLAAGGRTHRHLVGDALRGAEDQRAQRLRLPQLGGAAREVAGSDPQGGSRTGRRYGSRQCRARSTARRLAASRRCTAWCRIRTIWRRPPHGQAGIVSVRAGTAP